MARPIKDTVDYFPHIIHNGKTIFILENKFGNDGYAFWFKLLELLGSSHNHIYDFNNPSNWEFLIAKTNVSGEKATEILKTLADVEAIDRELLEKKVIWCENFIKGIEDVYRKRKQNRPQKPVIDDGNPSTPVVSATETPQSKVKETKVNKKKEKKEISFDFTKKEFINLDPEKMKFFDIKYPDVNIDFEIEKMENWMMVQKELKDHDKSNKLPKNYNLFMQNWFLKEQYRVNEKGNKSNESN